MEVAGNWSVHGRLLGIGCGFIVGKYFILSVLGTLLEETTE